MRDRLAAHIEGREVAGIVTLLSRSGETRVEAIGSRELASGGPMRPDTIFRIASMTKPIAAAAALRLVEEGLLELDEPVDRLLPELADRRVLLRPDARLDETVPAQRPISLRDLLTMRMGFGFVLAPPDTLPIQRAASELEVAPGPPQPSAPHAPDEWIRRMGMLPLVHQPGKGWMYETSFSVLGVLLARATGLQLEELLRERIFDPLGMDDTGFTVPATKLDRFAACYARSGTGTLELYDGIEESQWRHPPAFPDAGDGLVSTVDDYLAFGRMLLEGGLHGGKRILSAASVEAMTTNQLSPAQLEAASFFVGAGRGWGFGLSTSLDAGGSSGGGSSFGWDGGFGTSWRSDPATGLVGILMTQRLATEEESRLQSNFWTAAWESLG